MSLEVRIQHINFTLHEIYLLILFNGNKNLKGLYHGHAVIFEGLKMTFRTKIFEKKLYHVNQHQKYYKLCIDNFSLRPLFLAMLLIAVNFTTRAATITLSNALSAQENVSKLLTALSA